MARVRHTVVFERTYKGARRGTRFTIRKLAHGEDVKYQVSVTPKNTVWHDVPVAEGSTERSAWLSAFKLGQHNAGRRGIRMGVTIGGSQILPESDDTSEE